MVGSVFVRMASALGGGERKEGCGRVRRGDSLDDTCQGKQTQRTRRNSLPLLSEKW